MTTTASKTEPAALSALRSALRLLGPEPDSSAALVQQLGLKPLLHSNNLVAAKGVPTPLAEQLSEYVHALHRVGEAELSGEATAGMYLAYLAEWQVRSTDRERYRRKIAKALIEHQQQDSRWVVVLLDERGKSQEAEFVLPRAREGKGVSTVRASVNLYDPNRYHAELLNDLTVHPGMTLLELSTRWNDAFSVERVTKRFYEEFGALRDRFINALLEHNADNPVLKGRDRENDREFDLQLHAFGTRQLGRMLFLWFLQQKRWLGSNPGTGDPDFLTKLFQENGAGENSYYSSVLVPLFFDGLGLPLNHSMHKAIIERFGPVPYLGGGLFRAGADEFEAQLFGLSGGELERTIDVVLPDALFDPEADRPEHAAGRGKAERTVLGLLRGYRFTTQESTPDDQSVDPDPELLGKVFENLYQADERHQTGAYYTPREIVHYMCRQTLDAYLRERTGISQKDVDWLREEALDWTVSDLRLGSGLVDKLEAALQDVKILDPAVGSGAFLLAAIHEIVLLRRGIQQSELNRDVDPASLDVAEWKRHAATHCVYGVDINPMAVEICQLRLLLSLVVELDVNDFRDVPALPNLDFRIVAGDSLIDRMGEEPFFESLPRPPEHTFDLFLHGKVKELQKKVDDWSEKFAGEGVNGSDTKRLRDLRNRIRAAQVEIARIQLDHVMEAAEGKLASLKKPGKKATKKALKEAADHVEGLKRLREGLREDAPYQKPFLWFVNFHEVFRNGGFDVVLANPPYVRQEALDAVDQVAYGYAFTEVHAGTADVLVYFYARAVQLLRTGGQLAFITSNRYMRQAYGEGLRSFLPSHLQVSTLIDFGDLPLFTVAAYPAVLVGAKVDVSDPDGRVDIVDLGIPVRQRLADERLPVNTEGVRLALSDLPELMREVAIAHFPQAMLKQDGWVLDDPSVVEMLDCADRSTARFGPAFGADTYRGLTTGLNEAFVIDNLTRERLIEADPRSVDVIGKWLRGRDIKRWKPEWAELYVIAVPNSDDAGASNPWEGATTEAQARRIFEQSYPAIHEHLSRYEYSYVDAKGKEKPGLRPRADQGRWWWELRACVYYHEFDPPKIVWAKTSKRPAFAVDESGAYLANTVHFVANARPWLAAVLNSVVMEFVYRQRINLLRGGYIELTPERLKPLPLPELGPSDKEHLNDLAISASQSPSDALDREVDEIVARGLGLTSKNVQEVRTWLAARQIEHPEPVDLDADDEDEGD